MDELLDLLFLLSSAADSSPDTFAYASACVRIYLPDETFHPAKNTQSPVAPAFTRQMDGVAIKTPCFLLLSQERISCASRSRDRQ
ncbi:hypothetical protein [Pseudomonas sp. R2-60-08W]|uniref:hypothetical protein n=1 Tax=Pseudomonas sp. R2-60-08W TaxID=1173280 RepID=UPI000F55CD06|nr:hypothetical protein [Pseudomonas sp. R2-60-08W]